MNDTTSPSGSQLVARALAQSQIISKEASDGCWICQQKLWISVFFDEPRHDAESERGSHRDVVLELTHQTQRRRHELARVRHHNRSRCARLHTARCQHTGGNEGHTRC